MERPLNDDVPSCRTRSSEIAMAAFLPLDAVSATHMIGRDLCRNFVALCCMVALQTPAWAAWELRDSSDALRSAEAKSSATPVTATTAAPGQAGYVHYFLIRKPDGAAEMQVGVELADQSIAWAFPGMGVSVSPFIEAGAVAGSDGLYEVTHLFGIRPFPDDEAMTRLAAALPVRVMPWIDDSVPHCDLDPPHREACVSCLGFVLRMLFPGPFPGYPSLPADFKQARAGERYTTEDLLIYLAGLHRLATRESRTVRIHALDIPENMRDELLRVVSSDDVRTAPLLGQQPQERAQPTAVKGAAPRAMRRPRRL